jgi:opacity protein-like surface antigen
MRKLIGSVMLVTLLVTLPALAAAQRRTVARPSAGSGEKPSFGVELNWSSDVDFGIGGRGVFPLEALFPGTPLDGIVSFDYFFPGNSVTYWEINGDVAYRFRVPARSSLRPYAGAGLNIAHASAAGVSDTKAGLNLLGGTTFKVKGSITPFVEARGEIGGGKTFILTGGVRF